MTLIKNKLYTLTHKKSGEHFRKELSLSKNLYDFLPTEKTFKTQMRIRNCKFEDYEIKEFILTSPEDIDNLSYFSRWLMDYVMDIHKIRFSIISHISNRNLKIEEIKDYIKSKLLYNLPVLQGSHNQDRFKRLSLKNVAQDKMDKATLLIEEQYNKEEK